jgi:3-isopropylmalate dehydrogenase
MKIAVMPGDGTDQEVTAQAVKVLKVVAGKHVPMALVEAPVGQAGLDAAGDPLPQRTRDIAGKDIANPLASILSMAMMLRLSFGQADNADRVEQAVRSVLAKGLRTRDIHQPGSQLVGTQAMGDAVVEALSGGTLRG